MQKGEDILLSTTIEELLELELISVRTYNGCKSNGYFTVGSFFHLSSDEIIKWRNCGRKVAKELMDIIDLTKKSVLNLDSTPSNTLFSVEADELMENRDSIQIASSNLIWFGIVSKIFSILKSAPSNERLDNFKRIQQLSSILISLDSNLKNLEQSPFAQLAEHFGDRDFFNLLVSKHDSFLLLSKLIDSLNERLSDSIIELNFIQDFNKVLINLKDSLILKKCFPFLKGGELDLAASYINDFHKLPKILIAINSLKSSSDSKRDALVLCYYFGLIDSKNWTKFDIANYFDVTVERGRQMIVHACQEIYKFLPAGLFENKDFNWIEFITEEDEYINHILESQKIILSPHQLIQFIGSLNKSITYTSFIPNGKNYLLSKDLFNKSNLKRIDDYIKEEIPNKRMYDIIISVDDLILKSKCVNSSCNCSRRSINNYVCAYLQEKLEIFPENNLIICEQTHVSFEQILEIVSEKDSIVTRDEILEEAENRFPWLKISINDIPQNPLITAIGLKGYVPVTEKERYFSSIGDCVESILSQYSLPMSTQSLMDEILDRGYSTTLNSLRSLLSRTYEARFIRFEGELWGLRNKDYGEFNQLVSIPFKRYSFEQNLQLLKEHVLAHNSMPTYAGEEEEKRLLRWLRNIKNGCVEISSEQKELLNLFLQSTSHLPQNQLEIRFLQNCQTYKNVVKFLRKRPSKESRPQLFLWFESALKRQNLTSNNQRAFEELLGWLEDEGVYYG